MYVSEKRIGNEEHGAPLRHYAAGSTEELEGEIEVRIIGLR